MSYTPIIGMEVHVEVKTKSKMFCACPNARDNASPNTAICPICLAHPGTLPVPNKEAIRMTVLIGKALGCTIRDLSKFDRKHYFYPDLPKGYQISQYDEPIAEHGRITLSLPLEDNVRDSVTIGITRAHLEEDTAKLTHGKNGETFVDFNRAGAPLVEIVTDPDFQTALEAKTFCQELRTLLRALDVSDADMEKGHMRCEANISVQKKDSFVTENGKVIATTGAKLNPKVEVKNLNSFKAVDRAILYEIDRQSTLLDEGKTWTQETRGYDDAKGITVPQRSKENAADYRYFPEPDIPAFHPMEIAGAVTLPELPQAKRARFRDEYEFSYADAKLLTEDSGWATFTERVMSELGSQGYADDIPQDIRARAVGTFLTTKLMGEMASRKIDIHVLKISPENMAELIALALTKKVNLTNAHKILVAMIDSGVNLDPSHVMEEKGYGQVDDAGAIEAFVNQVIDNHPKQVAEYQSGKDAVLQFLKGMVMRASEGTVDPSAAEELLKKKLRP